MSRLRIAVLLGGTSEERKVSLASGRAVIEALRSRGHSVVAVDPAFGAIPGDEEDHYLGGAVGPAPPELEALREMGMAALGTALAELPAVRDADVAFIALHGGDGENGRVQALLDVGGVPYTGSGFLGSSLAFDKRLSKELLAQAGVPTPDWARRGEAPGSTLGRMGLPLVVKPSCGGSTVGLTIVRRAEELGAAIGLAGRYDDDVLCEAFVPGRELTVALLDGEPLPAVEIFPGNEIYDYESKYTPGLSRYEAPAGLDSDEQDWLAELAVRSWVALRQRSFSRIDFRRDENGEFWCLEANSVPGLTATSLVPKAAAAAGISFPDLCERIAVSAVEFDLRDERGS
ncbi:MAG: D-alanine--D-alanine ligase [marine benthic group bacterium]|nr:D-alanine--D-alanine ligase [Gemmatimonadota bacterium]